MTIGGLSSCSEQFADCLTPVKTSSAYINVQDLVIHDKRAKEWPFKCQRRP